MTDDSVERSLAEAFEAEARVGVTLAIAGRTIAFALLGLSYYLDAEGRLNSFLKYRLALIGVALLSGACNWLIARRSASPVRWSFPFLAFDIAVVAALVFGWLPAVISDYPQFIAVRYQDILLMAVVISLAVLPLSQRLVLFAGAAAVLVWGAGVAASFLRTPGAMTSGEALKGVHGWPAILAAISRPLVLNTDYLILQLVLLAVFAGLLSLSVRHGRRLVTFRVRAERDSSVLARFFPPEVARRLASGRIKAGRRRVAVLFADFDRAAPRAGELDQLGAFYAVCERVVFVHGGVIDRFVGDPVMATFGALEGSEETAPMLQAWRCARALAAAPPFGLAGMGLNLGEAVCGEMGSERQRAFGVVGEMVNTARRVMDAAVRRRVSIALTDVARAELPAEESADLIELGPTQLKGLPEPTILWGWIP